MKSCTKCGNDKPLDDFHRSKTGVQGRRANCKSCQSAAGFSGFCGYSGDPYPCIRGGGVSGSSPVHVLP